MDLGLIGKEENESDSDEDDDDDMNGDDGDQDWRAPFYFKSLVELLWSIYWLFYPKFA